MSTLRAKNVTLILEGQELQAADFELHYHTSTVDVASMGMPAFQVVPGPPEVTLLVNGVCRAPGGTAVPPPPPRDDIVTHLGTRCCCRHCPDGGDHA